MVMQNKMARKYFKWWRKLFYRLKHKSRGKDGGHLEKNKDIDKWDQTLPVTQADYSDCRWQAYTKGKHRRQMMLLGTQKPLPCRDVEMSNDPNRNKLGDCIHETCVCQKLKTARIPQSLLLSSPTMSGRPSVTCDRITDNDKVDSVVITAELHEPKDSQNEVVEYNSIINADQNAHDISKHTKSNHFIQQPTQHTPLHSLGTNKDVGDGGMQNNTTKPKVISNYGACNDISKETLRIERIDLSFDAEGENDRNHLKTVRWVTNDKPKKETHHKSRRKSRLAKKSIKQKLERKIRKCSVPKGYKLLKEDVDEDIANEERERNMKKKAERKMVRIEIKLSVQFFPGTFGHNKPTCD